jgi:hypothetical protein
VRARQRGALRGSGEKAPLALKVLVVLAMTLLSLPLMAGSCVYLRSNVNRLVSNNEWAARPDHFDMTLPGHRLPMGQIAMT